MKTKTVLLILAACGVTAAWGQAPQSDESLEARSARRVEEGRLELRVQKHVEVAPGKLTLDGIAVQMAHTDNLLQLFNPLAPERYGSAWDNVVWDPVTTKASGLRLFSISFGR
jgi:hypothetical protein